jgi:hypothetical protein
MYEIVAARITVFTEARNSLTMKKDDDHTGFFVDNDLVCSCSS